MCSCFHMQTSNSCSANTDSTGVLLLVSNLSPLACSHIGSLSMNEKLNKG